MKKPTAQIPSCVDCKNDNSVFCSLSKQERQTLGNNKGSNFYKKGQAIFYEGNHSSGLYCIYRGKVKLTKLGENGKEQIIRFAKTADILGYRVILRNESYQATATAMEDSLICRLSKEKFIQLMQENASLSWNTMKLLSNDLRKAEQNLISIAQKTAKERIAEALVLLNTTFGSKDEINTIGVALTRSEISDIAGTTTETTIRTISILKKEKMIGIEGKDIRILDLKGLTSIASIHD
jgi:CRP/FNR family transcriptional regulator, polysaccharide utilization system transcription regulator